MEHEARESWETALEKTAVSKRREKEPVMERGCLGSPGGRPILRRKTIGQRK